MKAEAFVASMDMIAKRSKARELVLTAEGDRIEPVEHRFGKRVEKRRATSR
jgi:hypothetical protein